MGSGFDPVISPEDAFDVSMSQRPDGAPSNTVLPERPAAAAPPATPPADPAATPAAPAAASPAPSVTPVAPAFPPPAPEGGFELVEPPAPRNPLDVIRQTVREAILPAPPAAAAPAAPSTEPSMVDGARAILADPESGPAEKLLARMVISQDAKNSELESRLTEATQRLSVREQAEASAAETAVLTQLEADAKSLMERYFITDAELDLMERSWDAASTKDPRLLVLRHEEAALRYFGADALRARLRPAAGRGAPPLPGPGTPPATPPPGHLISEASGGSPRVGTQPYVPIQRERGPVLEDARRAAHASIDGR